MIFSLHGGGQMSIKSDSYDRVLALGQKLYSVKISFKSESKLMRFLSHLLFFNKGFMSGYITVIGKTVYFPSREWLSKNRDSAAQTLCHEFVHIADENLVGSFVFRLSYLFPQWMSLFAFSVFFAGPWSLAFLIFLLPLPAPFRTFWELRGYAMTDAVFFERYKQFAGKDHLTEQFTSSNYYFMWPFKKTLWREIEKNREYIRSGRLHKKIIDTDKILSAISEKSSK